MRALVVFETMYGNTQAIANEIATGLSYRLNVDVVEVGEAPAAVSEEVGLVVVGGPTHAFGMSRPATRLEAARREDRAVISVALGIREWLAGLASATGSAAAVTFDTRVYKPRLPGSAARAAERRLRRLGFRIAGRHQSFYVDASVGPLHDGETERARAWGERLAAELTAGQARPHIV